MLLSIIIPVYNVEQYLKECVESILEQSFRDYEIILVDDGSTDSSGQICDAFQKGNDNIKTIHKSNGGLSDARNVGINNAKGEYILFIDSDDYIAPNSLNKIVGCLKKQKKQIDIMFLEAIKVYPDGTQESLGDRYDEKMINGQTKLTCLNHLARLPKFPASASTKLIRREFIVSNQLYFKKGLISEDVHWSIGAFLLAENFAYCNIEYYYYRQNRIGSITNSVKVSSIEDLLWIIENWSSMELDSRFRKCVYSFLAYEYSILLLRYSKLRGQKNKVLFKRIKKLRWILKYAKGDNSRKVSYLCSFLGVKNSMLVLRYIDKIRRNVLSIKRK